MMHAVRRLWAAAMNASGRDNISIVPGPPNTAGAGTDRLARSALDCLSPAAYRDAHPTAAIDGA